MAQLNDLLVLGYTNLLGTVNVFGEILADTFNGKFKGNGSLITNINAENISSGTLPVSRGGTGLASVTANSILAGNGSSSFKSIGTASGALYATSAGGAAQFGTLPVAQGGSGATTFTSNAVLTGNGTSAFKAVASASGALYATAANGAPVFGTLPVAQGGTGRTSWTAYSLVYASAAGALSSLTTGTSGYVLQSGGSSAAPSWINATNASTANTIVKRDANGGFSAGVIEAKVKKIALNGIDTATEYGDYGGIIQSSSDGPTSSQWHNSIKILHTNTNDHYYTQLAQQFTGRHGLWHRSMRGGVLSDWYKVMDIVDGESAGSATKPLYIKEGAWAECSTYAGGSRVKLNGTEYPGSTATFYAPTSAGTSGQVLVSSGGAPSWSGIAAVKKTTAAIEGDRTTAGDISALYLYGQTYGNTASNLATAGKMSYGDPGPQIIFNTGNISSPGSQAAALIFTDHDTIASGTSLSLVSNQGNVSFIAPTIKALTKFIGTLDGNASSATKLANARTINGTSFNGTADITTLNWGTARDITIGDTKRSVNGSQAYSWSATDIGYRHEWTASVKGVTWSRLCHVAAGSGVIGSKFILFIGATRGNVVYNDAYLITAHHSENGKIVKIAGHNYSSGYKIRLLSNANGDCYIELWDSCYEATTSTTQGVSCRLIPIFTGAITRYTTFTTGATLPSGYKEKQVVTVDNADMQAASINPTADGTGNIGSNSNKWNVMYANTFNGVATQINVNNTTPSSETKYYPLYANDVSGGQQVKANADFYYYDSGTWSSLNIGSGTNKGILSLHNSNKYVNLDPAALTANRSITIRDMDGYLGLATQYEYNKELAMGSTGKVCIGKFPMYDSNVTVRISSTTNTTYNGILVIATQNINTTGGGSYKAVVYGDEYNNLASSIKIHYGSGSNVFSVYIDLPGWSKNLVHVQCVGLAGAPTDVLTSVSSIPSTATITPTHVLSTATHVNSANSATTASKLNVSAGDIGQAIYFSGGQPAAIDWRIGNKDVGEHNANNVTYNFSGYYTSNGPSTTLGAQTNDGSLWAQAYNSTWVTQIAQDYRDGQLFVRSKKEGTWQAWKGIPMLTAKSVGGSAQPVYVNESGEITACTAYSGLFTGMSWSDRTLSLTIGGTTKSSAIPTNLSGFNRISFTTTDNTNSPTGQSIVLNGVTDSTDTAKSPGIGFHIGNKSWGSLRFNYDGTFHSYNNGCSDHMSVYASTFYGNLSGNATTSSYPYGFASFSTSNAGWGNQTGTTVVTWNDSTGGSVDWRRDNPSSGKISLKVDGRFYGNEGTNPAMLMNNTNGYWGIGDPDGTATSWIRTTTLGIIPYASGGSSSLGTDSWPFNNIYGKHLSIINDTSNNGTDALAYFQHQSNNDWTVKINSGGYDYGLQITNGHTATNALSVTGGARISNTLRIGSTDTTFDGSWREGIRIGAADGKWVTIALGVTGESGTNTNCWSIHRTDAGHFSISKNSSDGANGLFMNGTGMGLGTTGPSYRLHVVGDIYANGGWVRVSGNNGLYFQTHGGGWYMTDSTYLRSYLGKMVYSSGRFLSETTPSSWIDGQRYNNGAYNINDYSNDGSYNPWLRAKNTHANVSKWFSFGTLGKHFYWIGSATSRTDNGYDTGMTFNVESGLLYAPIVGGNRIYSGYDSGETSSISCSNWFRSSGATGWYNNTYSGGIYMQDTTYVRTYGGKAFYVDNTGDHAIYTAGGFASARTSGSLFASYYNSTWYKDTLYNHGNGNLSINPPGGNTYISYNRGLTYFGGGTYCIDREGYFNGVSSSANVLNINNTETKNAGRLQYFQKSGDTTMMPDDQWWSLIRTQHGGYNNGYWQEMAYSFFTDEIKFRRNNNGTKGAWKTIAFTDGRVRFLETKKQDGSGWYGDSYPLYAQWESSTVCKLKCDNYYTKVDYADSATKDGSGNTITSYYAPKNHASTATTYGVGNPTTYGHVKLHNEADCTTFTSDSDGACTPAATRKAANTFAWSLQTRGTSLSSGYSTSSKNDLNKTMDRGNYYSASSTESGKISNGPTTGSGYRLIEMEGYNGTSSGYGRRFAFGSGESFYFQAENSTRGSWGTWRTVLHTGNYTNTLDDRYLKLSGGTMTGTLTLQSSVYGDTASTGALNANNSNIYGINALYWADNASNRSEGINFIRTNGKLDTLWINDGVIYFEYDRDYGGAGTQKVLLHSGNWSSYVTSTYCRAGGSTTAAWYYPTWVNSSSTGSRNMYVNNGFSYYHVTGSTTTTGESIIAVGNSTNTGTDKNQRGRVRIYSSNSGYVDLYAPTTTSGRAITFPNSSGTVWTGKYCVGESGYTYGNSLPSSGTVGQIFFLVSP